MYNKQQDPSYDYENDPSLCSICHAQQQIFMELCMDCYKVVNPSKVQAGVYDPDGRDVTLRRPNPLKTLILDRLQGVDGL